MSLFKIQPDDIEQFTVVTNPVRSYSSSSLSTVGITGSVYVFARRSPFEKEIAPLSAFIDVTHDDSDINALLDDIGSSTGSLNAKMSVYLNKVHAQSRSARRSKYLDILRFTPSPSLTSNTLRKLVVKDTLYPYYRTTCPSMNWAYTNYNALNFFTSSAVPTGSVLLYPNFPPQQAVSLGPASGTYALTGAFSFDFFINPRYKQDQRDADFKAGTIFHLSSSYAVSLVSGSARDENGKVAKYRIKLQLSHSADVLPSKAIQSTYPNDLIFLSDDNCLSWNNWHRVVISWGTNHINAGTGSFNVDGISCGTFVVPSASINPGTITGKGAPDVLCIGNFYEGTNAGTSVQNRFFAVDPALREGLYQLSTETSVDEPAHYFFNHPLKAEVHDLSIRRYYESALDIAASASFGPTLDEVRSNRFAFYLPPFFTKASPVRQFVGDFGGILQSPFFEVDGITDDPFNVAMSFGVAGHYINLENFTKDFSTGNWPRAMSLTASALQNTTNAQTADSFLYVDPFVRKRNLTIMPCDDGNWLPPLQLLDGEASMDKSVDDLRILDHGLINLDNMVSTRSLLFDMDYDSEDEEVVQRAQAFLDQAIGFSPEQPGLSPGQAYDNFSRISSAAVTAGTIEPGTQADAPLTVFQRTRDNSSNQVTFFDVSNLFYGNRILPKSLTVVDSSMSGSGGAFGITLKDDGLGSLYRADSLTKLATWNSVGNIFYNEGILVIKSPHLNFFGKEQFQFDFRGEQNIHLLRLSAFAPAMTLNSSSNPSFLQVSASSYANDSEQDFVYISGINFHDDDLNIVAKTQLAQPVMKRWGSRLMFTSKIDF